MLNGNSGVTRHIASPWRDTRHVLEPCDIQVQSNRPEDGVRATRRTEDFRRSVPLRRPNLPRPRVNWRSAARLPLLSTVALGCAIASAAPDPLLDEAQAQLASQQPAGAYAVLSAAEVQRAGDPRFDYLLGVAALDSGHVTRAIFALERLVQAHPDDALGHAELGRAYLAAGDPENARRELHAARDGVLPEDAAAAIDRVLGGLEPVPGPASGPHLVMTLEIGGGYDSNVNSATNQGQFAIPGFGGILFDTGPDSRRRGDLFGTAAGVLQMEVELSPAWTLLASADARANANRVVHDMDTDVLDATLAVRHTVGSSSQTLALQDSTAWVDSSVYRGANGASAQWQVQFDPRTQGSVFAQWSHQVYAGRHERDTNRSVLGVAFGGDLGAVRLVYGNAYGADEAATGQGLPNFSHHALGLRLGFEQRIVAAAVGFVEWQHERRRYGGTEPFFEVRRQDVQDDLSAGLRYSFDEQWHLLPQIHATRARSNVVLYEYTRSVFQVIVQRSFK